jgi:hypothetical protein
VNRLAKNSSHVGANSLDVEDWQLLEKTHSFLQPFNQATLMIEKGFFAQPSNYGHGPWMHSSARGKEISRTPTALDEMLAKVNV